MSLWTAGELPRLQALCASASTVQYSTIHEGARWGMSESLEASMRGSRPCEGECSVCYWKLAVFKVWSCVTSFRCKIQWSLGQVCRLGSRRSCSASLSL